MSHTLGPRGFLREFLLASAFYALLMAWVFQTPILRGQVDRSGQTADQPLPQALVGMGEMVYEVQSALFVQTRLIKSGFFPSWSPFSQGGTPLVGKMQNGVFAPYHLLLYVSPLSWIPYLFWLITALKGYLAFAFAYLYARSLRLNMPSGIFAGTAFFSFHVFDGALFSWNGSGLYLPLILLVIELHFREHRRLARLLLPWAVALPYLSGHFESAFYGDVVAGGYFLARLKTENAIPGKDKFNRLVEFLGLSLLGASLAALQVLPAVEYVNLSYNKIWHTPKWFGFWDGDTVNKHLSADDAPMLAVGLIASLLFAILLRSCLRDKDGLSARTLGRKAAAGLALALAIACLSHLGLGDSLEQLVFSPASNLAPNWILGFGLVFLSFWGWRQTQEPGLRILGYILIAEILLVLRTPPLANLLLHCPPFGNFHNGVAGYRWEFHLPLGLLSAAALQKAYENAAQPWSQRLKTAANALSILAVFATGWLLAQALKGPVARNIPMAGTPQGGIAGPERQTTYARVWNADGWLTASPPVASVTVGLAGGNQVLASAAAKISSEGHRLAFRASLPLSEFRDKLVRSFAQIQQQDGAQRILHGPELYVKALPLDWRLLLACVLTFPAVLLLGSPGVPLAAILMVAGMIPPKSIPIAPDHIPYRLPGLERIKEDPELSRVFSTRHTFLQADYTNIYGLHDLRTGGDNLDVLSMIYFSHLYSSFLSDPERPAAFNVGLKLLGLANVKYLIDLPEADFSKQGLAAVYRGPEMSVFKNPRALPRAVFFDQHVYLPLGRWLDWGLRDQFLRPLAQSLAQGKIDPAQTLVLHDLPPASFPSGVSGPPQTGPSTVAVEEYSPSRVRLNVEAARPGFVFLSDNVFPGWRARLNGKSVKTLRSWITFRAVAVPAGKSSVEFDYDPPLLKLAVALAAGLSGLWLWLYGRYRLVAPPVQAAPALQPSGKKKTLPPKAAPDESTLAGCAVAAETFVVLLAGSSILFWTVWSVFIYRGGGSVRLAACGASLGLGLALFRLRPTRGATGPNETSRPRS